MIMLSLVVLVLIAGCAPKQQSTAAVAASDVQWNGQIKEFTVRAFQFGFDPNVIEVNKGDKVIINAYTSDVPHGFAINGYGIDLSLYTSKPQTVEFIADKPGTFTFYCSIPCGRGHGAMRGKFIVKG